MKLSYLAYNGAGQMVRDSIESTSAVDATDTLRQEGLFVTQICAMGQASKVKSPSVTRWRLTGRTRRLKNLAMFSRHLHVLTSSGTALTDALAALERQASDNSFRDVIADLRRHVEQGGTLSEAMARHPIYFGQVYRSLVTAAETSGKFETILDRLAKLARSQVKTRGVVLGALLYPALLLGVSAIVLVLMLTFVLPRFAGLFETLDVPLPPTTRGLLMVSTILRGYWWAVLGVGAAAAIAVVLYLHTHAGRHVLHGAMVRLPIVGPLTRGFATARIVRLLGVLIDSFVPLLEGLQLARGAAGNVHYEQLLDQAADAVQRGDPISTAFADDRLINPAVHEGIRSGEASGQLSRMLLNMADFADEENNMRLRAMTGLMEPVILIILGLLVAVVALSMFLPLFDLTAMAGGGG